MEKVATWFAIFIFYSFAGWLIEVLISFIQKRKIINRGFLVGPICPIYGTGALLLPFIVSSVETPLVIFCVAVVGSAILEYVVSYLMEKIFRVRWWDYTDQPFNLNGRICVSAALSFGVIGVLMLKVITPALLGMIGSLPVAVLYIIAGLLAAWLVFDILLSLWLIFGVRVTVGTVQRDATDEISERVQEILMNKGKLNRRLVKAFPNQTPAKKKPRTKKSTPKKQ